MFSSERLQKIREILLEYNHADVNTLSSVLNVSSTTVRRDLELLENEGFLVKVHGGAVLNADESLEYGLSNTIDVFQKEKTQIALLAVELIENNDVIYLGNDSICLAIAKNLKNKRNLTVVTTNISIVTELVNNGSNVKITIPGGDIDTIDSNTFMAGHYALNNFNQMYIGKSFFAVDGISLDSGYSINSQVVSELYKVVVEHSNDVIVLAEYTKFGKRAFANIMPLDRVKKIVTNLQIENEYKEYLFNNDFNLYMSYRDIKE